MFREGKGAGYALRVTGQPALSAVEGGCEVRGVKSAIAYHSKSLQSLTFAQTLNARDETLKYEMELRAKNAHSPVLLYHEYDN